MSGYRRTLPPSDADLWRWDTPPEFRGQTVEVQYSWGVPVEDSPTALATSGAPWERLIDHSMGGAERVPSYAAMATHSQETLEEILRLGRVARELDDEVLAARCREALDLGDLDAWEWCVRILAVVRRMS